ncbi:sulfatase-like hydrolase/transferase [Akkermansiaceae bacterium]|nr:sulfatase-like hydrolase/transferase [Akkermansiaceae bacterium]
MPTRVAFMTGGYPDRFGNMGLQASNQPVLPHRTLTLAYLLKQNGYSTHMARKWHLGSQPENGPNHHNWKILIYDKGDPTFDQWQLFNLKTDPEEKTNLAKKRPDIVNRLHQRVLDHRTKDRKTKNNL